MNSKIFTITVEFLLKFITFTFRRAEIDLPCYNLRNRRDRFIFSKEGFLYQKFLKKVQKLRRYLILKRENKIDHAERMAGSDKIADDCEEECLLNKK